MHGVSAVLRCSCLQDERLLMVPSESQPTEHASKTNSYDHSIAPASYSRFAEQQKLFQPQLNSIGRQQGNISDAYQVSQPHNFTWVIASHCAMGRGFVQQDVVHVETIM